MIAGLFLLGVLVVTWRLARRRRSATLAGLNSARPVFSVEPPTRRMSSLKGERL